MKRIFSRSLLLATSILALPFLAGPVLAVDAGKSAAESAGIPEIVVTAQRKAENVLSVPLSIQAITGEQLSSAGIKDISSLQFTSPGYLPTDSSGRTNIFVRGIGNSLFVGADPSVATFIDEVPRIYASLINEFVDVERIELLKGPQGGLYGRNATGGVLNIITRQPTPDKFGGKFEISYGEKGSFRAAGYSNIPIGEKVALLVAAQRERHDPFVKNLVTNTTPYTAANFPTGSFLGSPAQTAAFFNSRVNPNKGYNDLNLWSVDAKLALQLSENFKVNLAFDYNDRNDATGLGNVNPTQAFPQGLLRFILGGPGLNGVFPPSFFQSPSGKFTTVNGSPGKNPNRDFGVSGKVTWNLPGVDITAISAYRGQRLSFYESITDASVPVIDDESHHRLWFYYEELRAVSTGSGRFHYLAGATYLKNHFEQRNAAYILPPLVLNPYDTVITQVTNWSAYAQAGYDITQELNLTVSGRYIHEKNKTTFITPAPDGAQRAWKKFLPAATISYQLDGGGNIYGRYARGWKGGGINPVAPPHVFPDETGSVFKPETVDAFEVGYRAPLADNKIQVTAAAFYDNYKNIQVTVHSVASHPEIIYAIANAQSARMWGGETSVTWRVAEPVTLGISAGYLNTRFKRYSIPAGGVLQPFDLSGTHMFNAPKLQLTFTGQLDQPVNDNFRLVGNVLVSHISRVAYIQSGLPGVLPEAAQPGYWLANLRLGLRTSDDKWGFSFYGNNIFNKAYFVYGSSSSSTGNIYNWGKPRVMGGEIDVKF